MLGMLGPSPVLLVLLSFFRRYYCQWTTQQPDDPFFYFSFLSFVAVFVQETAQQHDDPFFYFSFRSFVAVVVKETTQQLSSMVRTTRWLWTWHGADNRKVSPNSTWKDGWINRKPVSGSENNNAFKKSLSGYENMRKSINQWKIKIKKAKFFNFLLSFKVANL